MRPRWKNLAGWISIFAHPFVMVTVLVSVAGWHFSSGGQTIGAVLTVAGGVLVPVAVLMILKVRRGHWANVDASNVSERPALFLTILAALAGLLMVLLLYDPESFLVRGLLVTGALLLVAAVLTRWVKVSLHLAFAGFTCTTLSLMGSVVGYSLIAVVPILAWSRLALARHQPREVAVGLSLGILAGVVLRYG